MVKNVSPGNVTIDTLNCGYENNSTLRFTTGDYAFGESYAVWGWA